MVKNSNRRLGIFSPRQDAPRYFTAYSNTKRNGGAAIVTIASIRYIAHSYSRSRVKIPRWNAAAAPDPFVIAYKLPDYLHHCLFHSRFTIVFYNTAADTFPQARFDNDLLLVPLMNSVAGQVCAVPTRELANWCNLPGRLRNRGIRMNKEYLSRRREKPVWMHQEIKLFFSSSTIVDEQ